MTTLFAREPNDESHKRPPTSKGARSFLTCLLKRQNQVKKSKHGFCQVESATKFKQCWFILIT